MVTQTNSNGGLSPWAFGGIIAAPTLLGVAGGVAIGVLSKSSPYTGFSKYGLPAMALGTLGLFLGSMGAALADDKAHSSSMEAIGENQGADGSRNLSPAIDR